MNQLEQDGANRRGFSRLELVVVVLAGAIVLALLVPWIVHTRSIVRRTQCTTNITNLTLAAVAYEVAHNEYPGWTQSYGWFTGTRGSPAGPQAAASEFVFHQKVGGWTILLLPYLDAQATYEVWIQDQYPLIQGDQYIDTAAPNLGIMQCPRSPTLTSPRGRNSYVSNNGMHHLLLTGEIPAALAAEESRESAALQRSMKRANGVLNDKFAGGGAAVGPRVRNSDLVDGLGNTVLFSENLQAGPWHQIRLDEQLSAALLASATPPGSQELPRSPDNDIEYPVGEPRFLQGFVWHWEDDQREIQQATGCPPVTAVHRINGPPTLNGQLQDIKSVRTADIALAELPHVARPSSVHVDGANIGLADGSSRFVTDTVDYRIYQSLMAPHDAQSDIPSSAVAPPGEPM